MFISIEITSANIRMLEGECNSSGVVVRKLASIKTPADSFSQGVISNAGELAQAISAGIKANGFKAKKAIITISSPSIMFKELIMPKVQQKEMRSILKGEVEQLALGSKQEFIADYIVIGQTDEGGKSCLKVLAAVVPSAMVQSYKNLLAQCGLSPHRMEIAACTSFKMASMGISEIKDGGAGIIAAIHEDQISLSLVDGDNLFCKNIAIKAQSDSLDNEFIITNISSLARADEKSNKIEKIASAAADNISRFAQFQLVKNRQSPVKCVYLCSDGASIEGFEGALKDMLGIELKIIDHLSFAQGMDSEQATIYSMAATALLDTSKMGKRLGKDEKKHLDFFEAKEILDKKTMQVSGFAIGSGIAAVAVAGSMIAGFVYLKAQDDAMDKKIEQVRSYVEDEENMDKFIDQSRLKNEIEAYQKYNVACQAYIDELNQAERIDSTIFEKVQSCLVGDVTINGFNLKSNVLQFYCDTNENVNPAAFAKNLDETGAFTQVAYTGFDGFEEYDGIRYSFIITCVLW